ncbi:helix-turn-helix domain-containing protein [Gordonia sp. WA4-43]|uniref:helix-turn-helix domain-containing protein n=1 Tax=Gordonia sp. WA4-43 TaxID=2878678 RepID=UPI0039AF82A2
MVSASEKARRQIRVGELSAAGYTADEIAEKLGVTDRTVQRDRTEMGIAADPVAATARVERHRPRCGTRNGYAAHQRRGEEPCEPCRRASAQAATAQYHRTRQTTHTKISHDLLLALYDAAPSQVQLQARTELGVRLDAISELRRAVAS